MLPSSLAPRPCQCSHPRSQPAIRVVLTGGPGAGKTAALEVIRKELDTTMALCGERDIKQVGRHNVMVPANWATDYA